METVIPQPFFFEAGERAVLLLHGFTGNSNDVRMLGRFLETKGYTCYAPQYKGHTDSPDELVHSTPEEWWQDILGGYNFLVEKGYNNIAVSGISLGGLFSLKLATEKPVCAVIPMCAPMGFVEESVLKKMVISYAHAFKKMEGKSDEEIAEDLRFFDEGQFEAVNGLLKLVTEVKNQLQKVDSPLLVIQGRLDDVIEIESPNVIMDGTASVRKELQWYEQSGHIITLEDERNKVEESIFQFLESIDWDDDESHLLFEIKETEAPQIWW